MAGRRYRVWPVPGCSDTDGETHFAVKGADVNLFARMEELAAIMQQALNGPPALTAAERSALRGAIGFVLAGEFDGSAAELRALRSASVKLGGPG